MEKIKNILFIVSCFDWQDLVDLTVKLANNQALLTIVNLINDVSSLSIVSRFLPHNELQLKVHTSYRCILAAVDVNDCYPEKELKSRLLQNILLQIDCSILAIKP